MQVNADTFAGLKAANPEQLGNANVNDAHDNIMAGALYLRDQMKAFGGDEARRYGPTTPARTRSIPATWPIRAVSAAQAILQTSSTSPTSSKLAKANCPADQIH